MVKDTRGFFVGLGSVCVVVGLSGQLMGAALRLAPFLDGGSRTDVQAVSGDGFWITGTARDGGGFDQAFRWTPAGPFLSERLGDLEGGAMLSRGRGVSSDGAVIVGNGLSAMGQEAFAWTGPPGMVGLGDLAGGSFISTANGASADGSVIVGEGRSTNTEAFRWTDAGGMVGLGFLPGGAASGANAVSPDGSVVVGFSTGASGIEAFRWVDGGGMIGLDTPGSLTATSSARDVSADGSVVVGEGVRAFKGPEAFRWTQAGGVQGLGDLDGGGFSSEARGVSADGSIVVGRATTSDGDEAFIWDQVNGMRNLAVVLGSDFGLGISGFKLTSATGISDNGQVVVGAGVQLDGKERGWAAYLGAYWARESGNGKWDDDGGNWLGGSPSFEEDVVIKPRVGGTIIGPSFIDPIGNLTIGAREEGRAVLMLAPHPDFGPSEFIAHGLVTIETRGGLSGNGALHAQAGIVNDGEIALEAGGQLSGGVLLNWGLVLAGGDIFNRLENAVDGEVRVLGGQTARFHGAGNSNAGEVNFFGGTVAFEGDLLNMADGFIGGFGVLVVDDGLTNEGTVALTGDAQVLGDIENRAGGRILVTGNSLATFFDDVRSNGMLRVSTGSTAVFLGAFTGAGGATGGGTLFFEGDLRPGSSPGAVHMDTDVVLGPFSRLAAEIGGPVAGADHDQVNVTGSVSFAGTLAIELIDGFVAGIGDLFEVMTFGDRGATVFDAIDGALVGTGLGFAPLFGAADLTLRASVPGDTNFDDVVSVADLSTLALNFGTTPGVGSWHLGDFNSDGQVTIADLSLLALNFGVDAGAGLATGLSLEAAARIAGIDLSVVPEPGVLGVLVLGLIGATPRVAARVRRGAP